MKRLMIPILSFLLTFPLNIALGSDCSEIDLTDPSYLKSIGKENLIEHFKEPRDQDSVGWCGAYASADALSFAVGEPVSALDVSINQYAHNNPANMNLTELSGITPNAASNVAMRTGYCPESVIPSNITASSNLGGVTLQTLMGSFQRLSQDFKSRGKPADYCVKCADQEYERFIKPALPDVNEKMIQEVLLKNEGDSLASIRDLMKKLCNGNRVKFKPTVKTYIRGKTNGRTFASIFNEALEGHSMPAIGMGASHFSSFTDEPHEMVIVGRRPGRGGKCEYIIRNSWGRGCGFYNSKYASTCNASKGTFVMNEDELQSAVDDVLVIKNEKGGSKPRVKKESGNEPVVTRRKSENLPQRRDSGRSSVSSGNSQTYSGSQIRNQQNNLPVENPVAQTSQPSNTFATGLGNFISSLWNGIASLFKF